jgi:hypothetical protein
MENFQEKKQKNELKEQILYYLFWFLFFLIILSLFINYYQRIEYQKNHYKGLLSYYYNEKTQKWETKYFIKNQEYIIPFYSEPQKFEKVPVIAYQKLNKNPQYVFLVFQNNSNYSVIATSFFNLARVLNPKGYYSFIYLYPAVLEKNKTIKILSKNMSEITKGYINCNMNKALFIVINDSSNTSNVILNKSCIFINGNKTDIFKSVDKATIVLLKGLKEKN